MTVPSVNFFYAGPSLYQYVNLTDAIFEPLVAPPGVQRTPLGRPVGEERQPNADRRRLLLVHQYRGMYAGALYTVERGHDLVDRINQLSTELVPKVEVDRARNMLADLEQRAVMARQEWQFAARSDPVAAARSPGGAVPLEHDHTQVTLIDPARVRRPDADRPGQSPRDPFAAGSDSGGGDPDSPGKIAPAPTDRRAQRLSDAGMFIQGGIFALGPNSSLNQWGGVMM